MEYQHVVKDRIIPARTVVDEEEVLFVSQAEFDKLQAVLNAKLSKDGPIIGGKLEEIRLNGWGFSIKIKSE